MLVFNHLQGRRLSPHLLCVDAGCGFGNAFLDESCEVLQRSPSRMPSPVGHALGGLTAAFLINAFARRPALTVGLLATSAAVAVAPDLDILVGSHRTYTHSVGGCGNRGGGSLARSAHAPCGRRRSCRADRRVRVASGARLDQQGHIPAFRIDGALAVHIPLLQVGARSVRRNLETLLAA